MNRINPCDRNSLEGTGVVVRVSRRQDSHRSARIAGGNCAPGNRVQIDSLKHSHRERTHFRVVRIKIILRINNKIEHFPGPHFQQAIGGQSNRTAIFQQTRSD